MNKIILLKSLKISSLNEKFLISDKNQPDGIKDK